MVLLIGIVVDSRPDLAGLILLDAQEVLLDMDRVAEVGGIAFARLEDDEDAVTGVEGAGGTGPARCSSGAGHRGRTIRHDHRASRSPYSGADTECTSAFVTNSPTELRDLMGMSEKSFSNWKRRWRALRILSLTATFSASPCRWQRSRARVSLPCHASGRRRGHG